MNRIFNRVAKWNAARYEQEFDLTLTLSLLREEYTEWLQAKTPVDKLDGLCDIIYVAMGAIWKAKISEEDLAISERQAATVVQNQINCNELWPAYYISTYLDVMEYDMEYPLASSLQLIITSAVTEMTGSGMTYNDCLMALNIVCDANDSKSIKKTKSNVKANDGDKGPYFIPPEAKLTQLLENVHARLN